jgi:hypothetical protein
MSSVDGSRNARADVARWRVVGRSLLSGLLRRCFRPLAMMVSASRVPLCFTGYDALDIRRGVPAPGQDRFAITSHRARNLVKLLVC